MKLTALMGNSQKLDGGAMFGNAPKALWSRWVPVDEQNRIALACRALLVQTGEQNLLFETGIGAYMPPDLRERYGVVESEHVLLQSLAAQGLSHEQLDVVVLSHLHFDHAGGLLSAYQAGKTPELLFPNARFYAGKQAWLRATKPHPRDRASFVPELNRLLEASGRLTLLESDEVFQFGPLRLSFIQSEGHTPGMMLSDLRWDQERLVFAADLIPGRAWVHLPITMGYDRFPERVIDEKEALLSDLVKSSGSLFFTHDAEVAMGRVLYDEQKRKYSVAV